MKTMEKIDFTNSFAHHFIQVNDDDDAETGPYRLFETEVHIAAEYEKNGYKVWSIMLNPDVESEEDAELIMEGIDTSPFCQGYFITNNYPTI